MGITLEDDTPMVATAFRGSDLTEKEESALDYLLDMMTAVKQQVLLRKALFECKHLNGSCDSTDFCSYGERKGGD